LEEEYRQKQECERHEARERELRANTPAPPSDTKAASRQCGRCHRIIPAVANFCTYCGQSTMGISTPSISAAQQHREPKHRFCSRPTAILLIALALLFSFAVAFNLLDTAPSVPKPTASNLSSLTGRTLLHSTNATSSDDDAVLSDNVDPPVAGNGSYYGEISEKTGLPRDTYVNGYYRRDGTYVRSYYRSR
jgi:hypothetical protein